TPQFALSNVPTLALRGAAPAVLQPVLNAFPLPNGRDLGNGLAEFATGYSDTNTLNAASLRLDHSFNSKLTLFRRYNKPPSSSSMRLPSGLSNLLRSSIDTVTFTAGATMVFTPSVSNEFRANYSNNEGASGAEQDDFGGAVPLPRSALIIPQYDSSTAQAVF